MQWSPMLPILSAALLVAAFARAPASPEVLVVANEYAFIAPDTLVAGMTTFTLQNQGKQQHEMLLGLMRPGVTAAQVVDAATHGANFRQLPGVYLEGAMQGALFAWPGTTSSARLTIDLVRGRSYVLLCTFRDSTAAPQHAAMGMFRILQVK